MENEDGKDEEVGKEASRRQINTIDKLTERKRKRDRKRKEDADLDDGRSTGAGTRTKMGRGKDES
jgi:hypothetical protein